MIRLLPLFTGLLPIVAIHVSLLVAFHAGVIPPCFPYLEGCTSISATGRYEPASFIFKPAMMTSWILLVMYWLFNVAWLRELARSAGDSHAKLGSWAAVFGIGGAMALVLYVTFLGSQGAFYEFMRRFGVYLYFLFTVIAQIVVARHSIRLSRLLGAAPVLRISKLQMFLALVPFVLGALNLLLKAVLDDADRAENVIEWFFALLMHGYFILSYFCWRDTGFGARFSTTAVRRTDY